jgi:hypothetical protein
MNDAGLPQEFQTAWRAHMKAWHDYANFLDGLKDSSITLKTDKENFDNLEDFYNNEINSTWYEVLSVADDNGSEFR